MTAILVVLTIIVAVAVDVALVKLRRRTAAPAVARLEPMRVPTVPPSVFLAPTHAWAHLATDGTVRIGADDFLAQLAGEVDSVEVAAPGTKLEAGDPLFTLAVGGREITVLAPFSGEVVATNPAVAERPYLAARDPYGVGWIVALWTRDLHEALKSLRIGAHADAFLRREMERLHEFLAGLSLARPAPALADGGLPLKGAVRMLDDASFIAFCQEFLSGKEA
ncbi:MAG: glycine cleavage system protein H [Thermoanaerobaculum sp.]